MAPERKDCRCCGKPLEEHEGAARRGVCAACASTMPSTAEPAGSPGGGTPAPGAGPPSDAPLTEHDLPGPGGTVGGLVVERRLGEGGMGHVLVARDPDLGRRVAVKFLRGALRGNARAERFFRREGRTLAGITHPHVVKVYSVGSWRGWPYLVMELVEGRTLADRLREGPVPLPEALRVARELASALAAVHAAGATHRDVNPSNVVLRAADGSVCLVDFGLAKVLAQTTDSTGGAVGTPLYMAPEQFSRQSYDQRVDIYSCGATLFEMLTGRLPHEGTDRASFFVALVHRDAPLLRTLRHDAPRALEVLVARCLARAPELRYPDGEALREALRAVEREAAGEGGPAPVDAAPPTRALPAPVPPAVSRDPSEALPLLGRNAEYAAAVRAIERIGEWTGQLLLVEGEAGSGKSRFLREVERAARAMALGVIRCPGTEGPSGPFRSLREGLLEYARGLGAVTVEEAVGLATAAAPSNRPLAPALRRFLAPRHGEREAGPTRQDLAGAALVLLRALIRERPALLLAEDIHLLDEGSLDVLVAAAEQGASWPLGVAASFRPHGEIEPRSRLEAVLPRLRAVPRALSLTLGPLPESAVASMIHRVLRVDEAEAHRLAPLLHRKSSGNPLYVVEALRLLDQERLVGPEDGRRRVRQHISSMAIPPLLLELAVRRISGLPAGERDALAVVSVDPEGVPSALVERCLDISRMRVLHVLQHLVRGRGLLRQSGERYWIPHAEIREAVYGEIIPELRAAYHAEAARSLGEAGVAETEPGRLGRHLREAGLRAEAVPHLLEAGRRHLLGHSPAEALQQFEGALACADPAACPPAAVGRAQALEMLGELEAARSALEALAAAGGEAATEGLLPLAEFERNRGHHRAALDLLARAEPLPLPPDRRIRLHVLRAQGESRFGRWEEALAALDRAEALAADASPVRRIEVWNTRGTVHWRMGRYAQARECFERALPLAEEAGLVDRTAILLYNLALVCSDEGRSAEALEWSERAIERSLPLGNTRTLVFARLLRADLLVEDLRIREAAATLDESAAGLRSLENEDAWVLHDSSRAAVELVLGNPESALLWCARGMARSPETPRRTADFRSLAARAHLEGGNPAEALAEARRARAALPPEGLESAAEALLALAARALRELGRDGEEREELRALGAPRTATAAVERALEAADPAERARRAEEARRLAGTALARAYVDRRLGGSP